MLAPNTILQSRYQIVRLLGQGGMGAVYEATDTRFGSQVALKEALVQSEALRRAFEREAKVLNGLRHAALPYVFDYFEEQARLFLVMQYIPGMDLAELLEIRGRPFDVDLVVSWADQLLGALEYLHTRTPAILHRDIKPRNLKLTPDGHIVLLDFGLVKGTVEQMTATGSVAAFTRAYAPYEQIAGKGTDARADLYSLGATLYHLLTGQPPLDAMWRVDAMLNHNADPLAPAAGRNPSVPEPISLTIASAMQLRREHRPESAAALREYLHAAVRASGPQVSAALPEIDRKSTPDITERQPTDRFVVTSTPTMFETSPQSGPDRATETDSRSFPPARPTEFEPSGGWARPLTDPITSPRQETGSRGIRLAVAAGALLLLIAAGGTAIALYLMREPQTLAPIAEAPTPAEAPKPARPANDPRLVLSYTFETIDGGRLRPDLAIPTGQPFRLRFRARSDLFVYMAAPAANGRMIALLTDRPGAAGVATNVVSAGKDLVFPGGTQLRVADGTTRFVVVVAKDRASVPAFFSGDALRTLEPGEVEATNALVTRSRDMTKVQQVTGIGDSVSVEWPEAAATGPVAFEVHVVGKAPAPGTKRPGGG